MCWGEESHPASSLEPFPQKPIFVDLGKIGFLSRTRDRHLGQAGPSGARADISNGLSAFAAKTGDVWC